MSLIVETEDEKFDSFMRSRPGSELGWFGGGYLFQLGFSRRRVGCLYGPEPVCGVPSSWFGNESMSRAQWMKSRSMSTSLNTILKPQLWNSVPTEENFFNLVRIESKDFQGTEQRSLTKPRDKSAFHHTYIRYY